MKQKITDSRFCRFIAGLTISRKLSSHPFFGKFCNYEMIAYLICGVLTTVINYVVYFLMPRFESHGADLILANIVAWIFAVLFAFAVNKVFVFDSPSFEKKILTREMTGFVSCRLLSLGMETVFLYIFVTVLHLNEPIMKILANVLVLIMNYFASKFIIFKK